MKGKQQSNESLIASVMNSLPDSLRGLDFSPLLQAAEKRLQRKHLQTDLLAFTKYFFRELRDEEFYVSEHHHTIVDTLKRVESGEITNLLINMPPRYGKTELAVINWMAQIIARNPKAKFIHLSYSAALALDNSSKVREIVKSPAYQAMWPVKIKDDSDSKQTWYTQQGGGLYATMAGGAVTGFGAGVTQEDDTGLFGGAIIIDDPIKPDDANSEIERQKINTRLNETIKSRRNSRKTPIIIIMQRLHADDMSGFVLDGGMGEPFYHLNLKALRDDGTALWPMKHTVEELEAMRTHDRMTFATQYQQAPVPAEGAVYKLKWFPRYTSLPQPPTRTRIIHSWDTAFKAKEHNDPSCCLEFHVTETAWYLADVIHGRWEYPELRRRFFELSASRKPDVILVEDKATGQVLIQESQRAGTLPVIAIKPDNDKETRARASAGSVESGKILLPVQGPWLSDFESEVMMFPNGKHDDRVDALSQFINYMRLHGTVDVEYNAMMERLYGKR
jgi:predicted phage terminase large subunit-like protein